jgi:hypothetical protein
MQPERHTYKGHSVELHRRRDDAATTREAESGAQPELLIDGQPVRYGQLPDGSYALHEYAYDWDEDLIDLARRFIDYRDQAHRVRPWPSLTTVGLRVFCLHLPEMNARRPGRWARGRRTWVSVPSRRSSTPLAAA